jgi:hypothetical protein
MIACASVSQSSVQQARTRVLHKRLRLIVDVLVLFNPEYDHDTYSISNGNIIVDYVIGRDGITRDDANAWQKAATTWSARKVFLPLRFPATPSASSARGRDRS